MRLGTRKAVTVLALALILSGCYGPFNLTRRLYRWNTEISENKWERELVFLLLALSPVYSFTTLADAVVFNAMEFWTGDNPVSDPARSASEAPQTKRLVRGNDEAIFSRTGTKHYRALTIDLYHDGSLVRTLRFERRHGEPTLAKDAEGELLLSAKTLPDGSIVVSDRDGKIVASYPTHQVEQFMRVARQ